MSRKIVAAVKAFAKISFLAFSIGASITGSLGEARSTWELYQQTAQNPRIEYVQDRQSVYPDQNRDEDEDAEVMPVGTAIAFCMTRFSFVVHRGCPYTSLTQKLGGFTYVVGGAREHEDMVGTLVIERPSNPFELQELVGLLERHSFIFAFQDGTGVFHEGNTFRGMSCA